MKILKNKKNEETKIFTDSIEEKCLEQVVAMTESPAFYNIRVMPDCHAGKGTVIGFTAKATDKIIPNVIGVDIGCGMLTIPLPSEELFLEDVDNFIRNNIPAGLGAISPNPKDDKRATAMILKDDGHFAFTPALNIIQQTQKQILPSLKNLKCFDEIFPLSGEGNCRPKLNYTLSSIGTLGSGNHFIEINEAPSGEKFLVIHSGSRRLGSLVADYYQTLANKQFSKQDKVDIKSQIEVLKLKGATGVEIAEFVKSQRDANKPLWDVPEDLRYLEGDLAKNYLHDMRIAQEYAKTNRELMGKIICAGSLGISLNDWDKTKFFHTIHNYVDENSIIRKGAISAKMGEKVLIPINMRDGSILAVGAGNADWNNSAPHGAGRLMSRSKAKSKVVLEDFQKSMEGIFSSTISEDTIDESPFAYKDLKEIVELATPTLQVGSIQIIKPIYNFKGEKNLPFVKDTYEKTTTKEDLVEILNKIPSITNKQKTLKN